jgi:uncharacterized protein (DUF58 family)
LQIRELSEVQDKDVSIVLAGSMGPSEFETAVSVAASLYEALRETCANIAMIIMEDDGPVRIDSSTSDNHVLDELAVVTSTRVAANQEDLSRLLHGSALCLLVCDSDTLEMCSRSPSGAFVIASSGVRTAEHHSIAVIRQLAELPGATAKVFSELTANRRSQ